MSPVQLEIFSDVICPWCYIGKTNLAEAVRLFTADGGEVALRYRPYLLQPDFTGPSRPMSAHLAERFGPQAAAMTDRVTEVAAGVGLKFQLGQAIAADTRAAHQLIELAYEEGGFEAQQTVAAQLFAAHFEHGEDVADPAVLHRAGAAAGLSDAAIERAASDPAVAAAVARSLIEAQQLGVTSVPTFVADRAIGVAGAQPPATLLGLLEQAAETARR
ncbi:MAG: hypothetical protein JWO63_1712 [Frankiales bacterium]|jgi:predicted DsbA family dithiol-disulfide isomerase|nr:hypothetical protein [Frankiales bacterium]